MNSPEFSRRLGSHVLLSFELDGRQHPVPHMLSGWVVEHFDVVEHVLPCVEAGLVGSTPYPLALEQIKETLGDRVVMTIAAPAHRVLHIVSPEE